MSVGWRMPPICGAIFGCGFPAREKIVDGEKERDRGQLEFKRIAGILPLMASYVTSVYREHKAGSRGHARLCHGHEMCHCS